MKLSLAVLPLLCSLTSAQLLFPLLFKEGAPAGKEKENNNNNMASHHTGQKPLRPDDELFSNDKPEGTPLLPDILNIDRSISLFSELTRKIESISVRVSDRDVNTTILAPTNVAITRLPRKPWEDPDDEGAGGNIFSDIYKGLVGEDRASRNERIFVEVHCIDVSPWPKGEKTKTLQGKEVWWDEETSDDGRSVIRTIYPDNIRVETRKGEASNGEVWVINGVINYAE